jgi:outer membrane lipoprotein-sorting protein
VKSLPRKSAAWSTATPADESAPGTVRPTGDRFAATTDPGLPAPRGRHAPPISGSITRPAAPFAGAEPDGTAVWRTEGDDMKKWTQYCAILLGVLTLCSTTARAGDLAAVEKEIVKKWRKHRSAKAKVTQDEATEAQGNRASKHGEGTYEFLRKGDGVLFREEMKSSMDLDAGGQKITFKFATLIICDGESTYELSERVGMKTAIKRKPDPMSGADLAAFLEALRTRNSLKLLDDAVVDGRDAYVIEATPKHARPGRANETVVYSFSKEHGFLLKQEARNKDGQVLQTKSFVDLEFDVDIDPKRFEFKAPEGVVVQDLTGE